jgi:hypothetical protein
VLVFVFINSDFLFYNWTMARGVIGTVGMYVYSLFSRKKGRKRWGLGRMTELLLVMCRASST